MIKISAQPAQPKPRPSVTKLKSRVSSLVVLGRLSPEIISTLLDMLDIRSIAHFARVSFRGTTLVQSQRVYRDLIIFVPQALSALSRVDLLGLHSVAKLHDA